LTSRDPEKGKRAATVLQQKGKSVSYHVLDVTDLESVAQLVHDVQAEHGRLDALINNAAVYLDEGISVFDVELDFFRDRQPIPW